MSLARSFSARILPSAKSSDSSVSVPLAMRRLTPIAKFVTAARGCLSSCATMFDICETAVMRSSASNWRSEACWRLTVSMSSALRLRTSRSAATECQIIPKKITAASTTQAACSRICSRIVFLW